MEVVLRGFPQSSYDVEEGLKQYHKFRNDLHVAEELVCYKQRWKRCGNLGNLVPRKCFNVAERKFRFELVSCIYLI